MTFFEVENKIKHLRIEINIFKYKLLVILLITK